MSTPTIEYHTTDKIAWGEGPWQSEPDKRQWADAATGLPCLIVRGPFGALCGYVGVPQDHPLHGIDYDATGPQYFDVHGGLTFADGCGHGDDPAQGICHIPGPGEPDTVWWFGFDCAHYHDLAPSIRGWRLSVGDYPYRDLAYVTEQVAALARQLANVQVDAP